MPKKFVSRLMLGFTLFGLILFGGAAIMSSNNYEENQTPNLKTVSCAYAVLAGLRNITYAGLQRNSLTIDQAWRVQDLATAAHKKLDWAFVKDKGIQNFTNAEEDIRDAIQILNINQHNPGLSSRRKSMPMLAEAVSYQFFIDRQLAASIRALIQENPTVETMSRMGNLDNDAAMQLQDLLYAREGIK